MDAIRIVDLRIPARIGVSDEERAVEQEIAVTADLRTDVRRAGASDELADTVDYHAAVTAVSELVRSKDRRLLEHLAEEIANLLLALKGVRSVTVEVTKENPPVEEDLRAAAVRIERDRGP